MEIFISWSGARIGELAKALREWLPCVMQSVKPWCSSEDIAKGARGGLDIAQKLGQVNFGIVCLTPSNLHNEWIHFESGALSKNLESSALFTLLLDLQPTDVKPPLGHFQHTRATKDELFKLSQAINDKCEKPLAKEVLSATFAAFWPKLESQIATLPIDSSPIPTARPDRELLEEILSAVRGEAKKSTPSPEADAQGRRAANLVGFADGLMKGQKTDGSVTARRLNEDLSLVISHAGEDFSLTIPADFSLKQAREVIQEYITNNAAGDDDIPF